MRWPRRRARGGTPEETRRAVRARTARAPVLVMAAAVADYRPTVSAPAKMKKSGAPLTIELEPTADIVSEVTRRAAGVFVVGFAAETARLVERATAQPRAKPPA